MSDHAPSATTGNLRGHIPALDGVRGIAILLVMIHHTTVLYTSTPADALFRHIAGVGWIGVDLFFVLSGFLITGILWDSKPAPSAERLPRTGAKSYFLNFYMRRFLRIFPLYYAAVFFFLVIAPGQYESVKGKEAWFWLYGSNFLFAREGRYIHGALDVSWSLAIEEQFYILWPLVVWLCSRRSLMRVCAGVILFSLIFRVWQTFIFGANHVAVYVLTPSRIDALAAGALLAMLARQAIEHREAGAIPVLARRLRMPAIACAAAAIGVMVAEVFGPHYNYQTGVTIGHTPLSQTLGLTLLAIASVGLTAAAIGSPDGSAVHRILTWRWLRTMGKYAYGLYLLHKPVRAIIRAKLYGPTPLEPGIKGPLLTFPTIHGSEIPGQLLFYPVAVLATLALAWISWWTFENQFLKLKRFFPSGTRGS